jgi:hypothetical protein
MNDRLSAPWVFVRVARLGSFSAGGRELSLPQPTVSRMISHLERDLEAALFRRTTRSVGLTDAGVEFLARVEPVLAELAEAEHAIRSTDDLRGTLRVGLSSSFAIHEITPRLPKFMENHPRLPIELITSDHRQDLVGEKPPHMGEPTCCNGVILQYNTGYTLSCELAEPGMAWHQLAPAGLEWPAGPALRRVSARGFESPDHREPPARCGEVCRSSGDLRLGLVHLLRRALEGICRLGQIVAAQTAPGELIVVLLPACSLSPLAMLACLAAGRPFAVVDISQPGDWVVQTLESTPPARSALQLTGYRTLD